MLRGSVQLEVNSDGVVLCTHKLGALAVQPKLGGGYLPILIVDVIDFLRNV
jgi:hypothetical protein